MIAALTKRMLTEIEPRLLRKFVYNLGWKGARAVRRFRRRVKRNEYFPAFLFISVTNRCNLRCQGCWVSATDPARELDCEALDRVVNAAKRQGVTFFGILGGEPLLHRGLFEFLAHHPDCYFVLFTNGLLLTAETTERMRQLGNVSPLVSIEGFEQVSDTRRGGTHVYERALAGLAECRRHRLVTGVASSICQSNFDELVSDRFVDDCIGRGVHHLWYYIYRPVGPMPAPELALNAEQVVQLRRFLVGVRCRKPIIVVDAYWDHAGRAMCPAVLGIAYHIGPGGDVEPCPPIQIAADTVLNGHKLRDTFANSKFLADFRAAAGGATRGCVLLERPDLLLALLNANGAKDSSGRDTVQAELARMSPRSSHDLPGREIPEQSWFYRFAKKNCFFGLGAYG